MHEFFADRPYSKEQVKMFGWTLEEIGDPSDIAERTLRTLNHKVDNNMNRASKIDTICVHSDTPGAPEIIRSIRERLAQSGWSIEKKSSDTLSVLK